MTEERDGDAPVHPLFSNFGKKMQFSKNPMKLAPIKQRKKRRRRKKKRKKATSLSASQDSQISVSTGDDSFTVVSPSKKPTLNINTDDLFSLSVANKRKRSRRRKKKRKSKPEVDSGFHTPISRTRPGVENVEIVVTRPSPEISKENDLPMVKKRIRKRNQYKPPRPEEVDEYVHDKSGEDEFEVHTNPPPPPPPKKEKKEYSKRKYVRKKLEDVKPPIRKIKKISRKRNSDDIRTEEEEEDNLEEEIDDLPAVEEREQNGSPQKSDFKRPSIEVNDDDDDDDDELLEEHEFLDTPKAMTKTETEEDEEHEFAETPREVSGGESGSHSFPPAPSSKSPLPPPPPPPDEYEEEDSDYEIVDPPKFGAEGLMKRSKEEIVSQDDPEVQSMTKLPKIGMKKRRIREGEEVSPQRRKRLEVGDAEERVIPKSPKQREESSELRSSFEIDEPETEPEPEIEPEDEPEEEEEEEAEEKPQKKKRPIFGRVLRSKMNQQPPRFDDEEEEEVIGEQVGEVSSAREQQDDEEEEMYGEEGENEEIYGEVEADGEVPLPADAAQEQSRNPIHKLKELGGRLGIPIVEEHVHTAIGHVKSAGRRAVNLYHNYSIHDPLSKVRIPESQKELNRFRSPLSHQKPIMQVTVLRTRMLRNVVRPFVKVTFIDTEKRTLLGKGGGSHYNVSHQFEYVGEKTSCGHVLPQSTKMFPVFKTKSYRPVWNERLLFNEDFHHFMNPNAVVVFEILDFDLEKKDMVYVCWGFLKLISLSGRANARRVLPIKLFKYPRSLSKRVVLKHPETKAFYLWASKRKRSFPSVLQVSVDPAERKNFIPDCPDLSPARPNPLMPVSSRRTRIIGEEEDGELMEELEEAVAESKIGEEGELQIDTESNVPPPDKSLEKKSEGKDGPKTPESPESKRNRLRQNMTLVQQKRRRRDSFGRRIVRFPRRTKNIFEVETGRETFEELATRFGFTRIRSDEAEDDGDVNEVTATMKDKERKARDLRKKLRRKNHERCKIPDTPLFQFETAQFGCLRVSFSPASGVYLACCCVGLESSVVRVYNVWTGQLFKELVGHRKIIYDVCWGKDDTFLVTAGQDGTARIYDFTIQEDDDDDDEEEEEVEEVEGEGEGEERRRGSVEGEEVIEIVDPNEPKKIVKKKKKKKKKRKKKNQYEIEARCILPHPCFVYCVRIYYPPPQILRHRLEVGDADAEEEEEEEEDNRLVLTGGYDHMIRIFSLKTGGKLKEISHHHARVNSILFDRFKRNMYTADGSGMINKWRIRNQILSAEEEERGPSPKLPTQFVLVDTFKVPNCHAPLTTLYQHPERDDWLFVHSQDNMIRLMSTVHKECIGKYTGVKCILNAQRSTVSPDEYGSFLVTGSSNDGNCYFWKRKEQKLVRRYGLNYGFGNNPIYDIAWSKKEHVIALCSYGVPEPVRLYCYEKKRKSGEGYDDSDDSEEDEEFIVSLSRAGMIDRKKKKKAVEKKAGFDWGFMKKRVDEVVTSPGRGNETFEERMKRLFSKTNSILEGITKEEDQLIVSTTTTNNNNTTSNN